ncbi:MAG: undecaprenyl-diphosphate phosphatase [Ruminococcaceae bacterium]|nr:undecaprenyl-diphosphate phosphatase [Oscillospiraceae bacterium]
MDTFILILQSIVQGIVQGITEWLPISSTGHLKLLNAIWPMAISESFGEVFEVVIQLGSILAVLLIFFHKLNPFSKKKTDEEKKDTLHLWGKVLIASVPAAVIGLLIDDWMNSVFQQNVLVEVGTIATTLILYGIGFIILETVALKTKINGFEQMSPKTAAGIGLFQCLALIPGTSRSGSTILGASILGTSRTVATEFSFFMAIPVMLGASGLKAAKMLYEVLFENMVITSSEWLALGIATVVSFAVSVFAIRFLMGFIKKHDFKVFGWYRIALGVVLILCLVFCRSVFK